jgi:phosphoribosylanthranilate isomerase
VATEIKFCGLTREEDVRYAVELGASYVGVIFAGGARLLTLQRAVDVLRDVPPSVRRVGVFGDQTDDEIARIAGALNLGVIQLHASSDATRVASIRAKTGAAIWPVVRVAGVHLPAGTMDLPRAADGLLLDAFVPGALGGTGVALPWPALSSELQPIRGTTPIILAGGLRPENVAEAIAAIGPDVVDVSSGVESAPGIKDHERMRAFRDAVTHASIPT